MGVNSRTDGVVGELMIYLSQYSLKIVYGKGMEADTLSRDPVMECFGDEGDAVQTVNCCTLRAIEEDREAHEDFETRKHCLQEHQIRAAHRRFANS